MPPPSSVADSSPATAPVAPSPPVDASVGSSSSAARWITGRSTSAAWAACTCGGPSRWLRDVDPRKSDATAPLPAPAWRPSIARATAGAPPRRDSVCATRRVEDRRDGRVRLARLDSGAQRVGPQGFVLDAKAVAHSRLALSGAPRHHRAIGALRPRPARGPPVDCPSGRRAGSSASRAAPVARSGRSGYGAVGCGRHCPAVTASTSSSACPSAVATVHRPGAPRAGFIESRIDSPPGDQLYAGHAV